MHAKAARMQQDHAKSRYLWTEDLVSDLPAGCCGEMEASGLPLPQERAVGGPFLPGPSISYSPHPHASGQHACSTLDLLL